MDATVSVREADDKVRLANLYLYHVIAFINGADVITMTGEVVAPDERIMRYLENEGGISETECLVFRHEVVEQLPLHRMDKLYTKLNDVFEFMINAESSQVALWLEEYPHTLPLFTPPNTTIL